MHGFLGNVAVNVVANLVAAAIIYLLGVYFSLIPGSRSAVAVAFAVVIAFSVALGLFIANIKRDKTRAIVCIVVAVLYIAGGVAGFILRIGLVSLATYVLTVIIYLVYAFSLLRNEKKQQVDGEGLPLRKGPTAS